MRALDISTLHLCEERSGRAQRNLSYQLVREPAVWSVLASSSRPPRCDRHGGDDVRDGVCSSERALFAEIDVLKMWAVT